eukprot:m.286877 g.286877  ORF g.286877 m.286877 type:complete len:255 (+) comp55002_c0_seq14:255-1019(+)
MDATADADFEKEVKFLHSVRHKNIVSFLGAGNQPGAGPFFVVEYCTRGSLQGIIKDQLLRLTMSDIISMALDAAQGMNFLHSCEPTALHRDLKSLNLLVTENWTVKVADFGTAVFANRRHAPGHPQVEQDDDEARPLLGRRHQQEGMYAVGTVEWCAPEVLSQHIYSIFSDVHSFGMVLWELLTRKVPFGDIPRMRIRHVIINGTRPPSDCDSTYRSLMVSCWHPDRERQPTFHKIIDDLEAFRTTLPEPFTFE